MGRNYGKMSIYFYSRRGGGRGRGSGETGYYSGGVRRGGGRGIGRSNISRPNKKYLFKRRIGGDGVSADAALAASPLTAATANNRQQNVLSSASWGGAVTERMGGEAP